MNPLKSIFRYVFPPPPPADSMDDSAENVAFEWNPEDEAVAPTSARDISWKRGTDEETIPRGETPAAEIHAAAHSLPSPTFERHAEPVQSKPESAPAPVQSLWNEDPTPIRAAAPAPTASPSQAAGDDWVKPSAPAPSSPVAAALSPRPAAARAMVPPSDFEDVYRKAGIKSPVHGYGVERVYRLLTSRRLVGLDHNVRRSALLTALDAAGVPASDVSQDAVLRRKALTAFEAEKALELQSLRSRNESRAEALQDTVETFTRQKQSQIERLAQGSTNAVRAQSDLEIRKRMEQDRLFRSLSYFVEPLPSPTAVAPAREDELSAPVIMERFDRTIEMVAATAEQVAAPERAAPDGAAEDANDLGAKEIVVETESLAPPAGEARGEEADPGRTIDLSTLGEASPETPAAPPSVAWPAAAPAAEEGDAGAQTLPISSASALEMALKAAAEEARSAGWGRPAVSQDGAGDAVDALRKLRETPKTDTDK